MKGFILSITIFVLAGSNFSSAQEIDLDDLKIDSSKITLWVLIMEGCVIRPVSSMEFKFYTDSTIVKFKPAEYDLNGMQIDDFKLVVVPLNLWNKIKEYQKSLEDKQINSSMAPFLYCVEFDMFVQTSEFKITPEEHLVLADWFDEFSTKYK